MDRQRRAAAIRANLAAAKPCQQQQIFKLQLTFPVVISPSRLIGRWPDVYRRFPVLTVMTKLPVHSTRKHSRLVSTCGATTALPMACMGCARTHASVTAKWQLGSTVAVHSPTPGAYKEHNVGTWTRDIFACVAPSGGFGTGSSIPISASFFSVCTRRARPTARPTMAGARRNIVSSAAGEEGQRKSSGRRPTGYNPSGVFARPGVGGKMRRISRGTGLVVGSEARGRHPTASESLIPRS